MFSYITIGNGLYMILVNSSMCKPDNYVIKKTKLLIGCWNINGYKCKGLNKYSDPDFIKEITSKDIICLLETHCPFDKSISVNGYKTVILIRPRNKKTKKYSGGITILVKDSLKQGVKFLEHKTNDYMWLKLNKLFFGLNEDLFICFYTIPQKIPVIVKHWMRIY